MFIFLCINLYNLHTKQRARAQSAALGRGGEGQSLRSPSKRSQIIRRGSSSTPATRKVSVSLISKFSKKKDTNFSQGLPFQSLMLRLLPRPSASASPTLTSNSLEHTHPPTDPTKPEMVFLCFLFFFFFFKGTRGRRRGWLLKFWRWGRQRSSRD